MAVSGFEGFEKRLELHFSSPDPTQFQTGLRSLDFGSIEQVLQAVQCTVVSAMSNQSFDAYVLSESSLFVYPTKIIIKTCGTTQLLKSIPPLISHAHSLDLHLSSCKYSRGSFIFPKAQPSPHTSFTEEVGYLDRTLPARLCCRKARVLGSKWHVYCATDGLELGESSLGFTMEVCMTRLDRGLARRFFRRVEDESPGDVAGREMTRATGIGEINPNAIICEFAFDPCGYSMNGMDGANYSTIHVTPEDGFSYASFECVGSNDGGGDGDGDVCEMLKKVVRVFGPGTVSVAMTGAGRGLSTRLRRVVESFGLTRRSCSADEFPAAGSIVFQSFMTRRNSSG